jgi:hypothetical protein
MHVPDTPALTLPPQVIANPEFRLADRVATARRFLAARGIREPRPLYGAGARRPKLTHLRALAAATSALA